MSRVRRKVSLTPTPSPSPVRVKQVPKSPVREEIRQRSPTPPRRMDFRMDNRDDRDGKGKGGGKGKFGGGGGGGDGGGKGGGGGKDWLEGPDEGWLADRVAARKKAHFGTYAIFPRSPTPKREPAKGIVEEPEQNEPPAEMTQEEKDRSDKFQAGLKKAMKGEAKEFQKQQKKEGKGKEEKKDKKEKKEDKKEKKKDKKAKKGSDEEAEGKSAGSDAEDKKDKKNKKDKKSKKHKKKKGKSDKKKKASSSSEADEGNSQPANRNILPPQMVGATIELDSDDGRPDACAETKELQLTGAGTMDVDKPEHKAAASRDVPSVGMPDSSPEDTGVPRCPKGHTLAKLAIGLATSGHNSHTCDKCKVRSKVSGAKEIYRCKACNFDMCVRCYARLLVLGEDADCSQASEKERAKLKVTGDDVLNEGEPAGAAVSDPYECPGLEEPAAKVRKVTDDDDTNLKVLLAKKKSEQKKLKKKEPVMPDIPDPSEAYAAYRKGPRGAPGGSFAGDY